MAVTSQGKLLVVGASQHVRARRHLFRHRDRPAERERLARHVVRRRHREGEEGHRDGVRPRPVVRATTTASPTRSPAPWRCCPTAGSSSPAPSAPPASRPRRRRPVTRPVRPRRLARHVLRRRPGVRPDQTPGRGPDRFNSMAVLRDGRILAGGSAERNAPDVFGTTLSWPATPPAAPWTDRSGPAGSPTTDFTTSVRPGDTIRSLLVQRTARCWAVGSSQPQDHEEPTRTAMARYNANGSVDNSFSGDGKLLSEVIASGGALAAAGGAGRRTVVVGTSGSAAVVARFGADAAATASVSGTFYKDAQRQRAPRNSGEPVLAGWQAFVDQNNDGFYTPGEKIATSNSAGVVQAHRAPARHLSHPRDPPDRLGPHPTRRWRTRSDTTTSRSDSGRPCSARTSGIARPDRKPRIIHLVRTRCVRIRRHPSRPSYPRRWRNRFAAPRAGWEDDPAHPRRRPHPRHHARDAPTAPSA